MDVSIHVLFIYVYSIDLVPRKPSLDHRLPGNDFTNDFAENFNLH